MQKINRKNKCSGFAAIKMILGAVVIVTIGGALIYVFIQRGSNSQTNNPGGLSEKTSNTTLSDGTTSSILTLTEQDAQIESGVDSSSDDFVQQNTTSINSAASNLGGVYDENNF